MHGHDDAAGDDALGEGDELLGDAPKNQARVRVGRRAHQLANGGGDLDGLAAAHRLGEERVFGDGVAEQRGGRHAELAGDVGQGGGGEALGGENAAGGVEDLIAADARRAAHL
jgi:hypothetical protein